jgi:hypothetical protein
MRQATIDDKGVVEQIVNHPEVWKHVAPDGAKPFDATHALASPHIVLLAEGGCFIFQYHSPGTYEVHTNFLPTARGKHAYEQAREAAAIMFLGSPCMEILTRVPEDNPAADVLTRKMHFRKWFTRQDSWRKGGKSYAQNYYRLGLDEWISDGFAHADGCFFHQRLHQIVANVEHHEDDYMHDCYVGAIFNMLLAGQPQKGVEVYNRWARFAGYQPIRLLSQAPIRVDIQACILRLENGDFAVEGN